MQPDRYAGATRVLGGPLPDEPWEYWYAVGWVNGNHGSVYVLRTTGLFVASLFEVMRREKIWRMPGCPPRNMTLDSANAAAKRTSGPV